MKKRNLTDDHHCSTIEKKRLKLDFAYCNAEYNSKEALDACYSRAVEASGKREFACKYS